MLRKQRGSTHRPKGPHENGVSMKIQLLTSSLLILLVAGCNHSSNSSDSNATPGSGFPAEIVEQRIQPADTGDGIDPAPRDEELHHVAQPATAAQRKGILIVYMVGSGGSPDFSLEPARFAASLGFGVLNIQYPNTTVVGVVCGGQADCFGQFRGETVFGENVAYAPGLPTYNQAANFVTRENSVVNRVANLLDFLANQTASDNNPDPGYWQQFLVTDSNSPYSTRNNGFAYPDWSKIVIAGHSQGGGMASMLAMNLADVPARRVIMFSSPNDNSGGVNGNEPATWMLQISATAMSRFWGLRHPNDTTLGPRVQQNWERLGGPGSGGVGGPMNNAEVDIGNGTGDPAGAQRLVITEDVGGTTASHQSTVDPETLPTVIAAWEYLFSGGGAD